MKIRVVKDVLDANNTVAAQNRELFANNDIFVLNVMSSPGSGKTTLLEKSLPRLMPGKSAAVVVGDICTSNDAERLAGAGGPVVQINTDSFGGDCHLGAHVVREALTGLDLAAHDLLVVENVGNLVCPAEFDIGESARAVVLSVTEGEDKPLKYPLMFRVCDVAVLNKIDLLPHLVYDRERAIANMRTVNPDLRIFEVSAYTGEGMDAWLDWLGQQTQTVQPQPI
jgi:hydrogenase nickel incorporation protein HypB